MTMESLTISPSRDSDQNSEELSINSPDVAYTLFMQPRKCHDEKIEEAKEEDELE